MTVQLTGLGLRAYQILAWAYEDLNRVPEAQARIGDLLNEAGTNPEKYEVGDVSVQLSRLADSASTMPSDTVSISGQMR